MSPSVWRPPSSGSISHTSKTTSSSVGRQVGEIDVEHPVVAVLRRGSREPVAPAGPGQVVGGQLGLGHHVRVVLRHVTITPPTTAITTAAAAAATHRQRAAGPGTGCSGAVATGGRSDSGSTDAGGTSSSATAAAMSAHRSSGGGGARDRRAAAREVRQRCGRHVDQTSSAPSVARSRVRPRRMSLFTVPRGMARRSATS